MGRPTMANGYTFVLCIIYNIYGCIVYKKMPSFFSFLFSRHLKQRAFRNYALSVSRPPYNAIKFWVDAATQPPVLKTLSELINAVHR